MDRVNRVTPARCNFLSKLCCNSVERQVPDKFQRLKCHLRNLSHNFLGFQGLNKVELGSTFCNDCTFVFSNHCKLQLEIAMYDTISATCSGFLSPTLRGNLQHILHRATPAYSVQPFVLALSKKEVCVQKI